MREAALRIALDAPVFPCRPAPEKSPLTRHGFKDATTNPQRIEGYWERNPDASIGVPTGKRSGFFVVDVDSIEALEELGVERFDTYTVRTPKGGLHAYFRYVEGITNSPGSLPDGIDVRGEGGYVLVPPSPGYTVEVDGPIASVPLWLFKKLKTPSSPAGGRSVPRLKPPEGEPIPKGARNRTLFFRALDLKDAGHDHAEVPAMIRAINERWCLPEPLPDDEVGKIVASAMRYPIRRRVSDPRVEEIMGKAWEQFLRTRLPGGGGSKLRDCERVLHELGGRFGRFIEVLVGGKVRRAVAVSVSSRQGALPAATSHTTWKKSMRSLVEEGTIIPGSEERGEDEGATWLILEPPATKVSTQAPRGGGAQSGNPCRTLLQTPCFRWGGIVGTTAGGVLLAAEQWGPQTADELAARVGWTRTRDLKARHLDRLVGLGLLEEKNGVYVLPGGYVEQVEVVRSLPYTTTSRRRRKGRDGARMVASVQVTENTASEAERAEELRKRYERERHEFRKVLERRRKAQEAKRRRLPEGADGFIEDLERVGDDHHPEGCQCLPCYHESLSAEEVS